MVEIHPYIADLPIFQDRVDAMAESIAEIGLLHPISLDSEGRVIGGRHRLAACEKVGVEPQFETREENPLVFMLHDNDDRKHQTTGQLTAERAMTLHSAGHRSNGRWDYGEVAEFYTGVKFAGSENVRLSEAGVVLDFLGRDVLAAIAAGTETLKEQLAIAKAEKQRREAEEQRRIEEANRSVRTPLAATLITTRKRKRGSTKSHRARSPPCVRPTRPIWSMTVKPDVLRLRSAGQKQKSAG